MLVWIKARGDVMTRWPVSVQQEFFEDNREYWPDDYLMYVAM